MKARGFMAAACLLVATGAHAGHGLMNSFGDVEWLPDPGATPDQFLYPVDRMRERIELELAESSDEEMALCLAFGREKLAEATTMINAGESNAAVVAIEAYGRYIEQAAAAVESAPAAQAPTRRHRFVNALLEHLYIMSVEYLDMPLEIRRVVAAVFTADMAHYERHSAKLPKRAQEALFFKEDEIHWSLEMIRQADLQRITN